MNRVLSILIVIMALCAAGCMQATPPAKNLSPAVTPVLSPEEPLTSNETLVAFVDEAVAYARVHGREAALREFNNPGGSFVRGELYIYAYDFNSTTLAHPFEKEKIGISRRNETDAFGNPNAQGFLDAVNGSGFLRFYYENPAHNGTLESKLGYVKKVDNDWWLGSGIYTGPAAPAG
jgi:hypothetical protein